MAMQLRAFRAARTFDDVAALYQSLTPWSEGNHYGAQKGENKKIENHALAFSLSPHLKRYVTLRPVEHGYAARYHDTDVVTWVRRRDQAGKNHDSVRVRAFPSISTESFADDFTPNNLRFKLSDGYFVRVAQGPTPSGWYYDDNGTARCYEFDSEITFDVIEGKAKPIERETKPTSFIDPRSPLMRASLLKTEYFDFMSWSRARLALHGGPITESMLHPYQFSLSRPDVMLSLLADPNKWEELLFASMWANSSNVYSHTAWLDDVGEHVRMAIYKEHKAVRSHEVSWYLWSQFQTQRKLREKYPWAM